MALSDPYLVSTLASLLLLLAVHVAVQSPTFWDKVVLVTAGAAVGTASTALAMQYKFYVHYAWWRVKCWMRHCWSEPAVVSEKPACRKTMPPPHL